MNLFDKNKECIKILKSRKDIQVLGFRRAYMLWGKHLFSISHKTSDYNIFPPDPKIAFRLSGHRHALYVRDQHIFLPPLCMETATNIKGAPLPGFVIGKMEGDTLNFFYYVFEEKLHKHRTEIEIKVMKKTRLNPKSYGKILSIKYDKEAGMYEY